MKEEKNLFKTQSISAKDKEDLESRLAKAEFEASFYLTEKFKAEEKLKETKDRTNKADHEF